MKISRTVVLSGAAAVVLVGGGVTAAVGLSGSPAGAAAGSPVHAAPPTAAPPTHHRRNVCAADYPLHADASGRHGLVDVRRNAVAVTVVWLPGLNSKRCASEETVSGRRDARAVAAGVLAGAGVPKGVYNCPMDDATRAVLYLGYRHGTDQLVQVSLAGCRFVGAPDRGSRSTSRRLEGELRRIAPPTWRSYLPRN